MKIYGNIDVIGLNNDPRAITSNGIKLSESIEIDTISTDLELNNLISNDCVHISGGGDTGLFAGGFSSVYGRNTEIGYCTQIIDCISISYGQNASEFGNLYSQVANTAACSNGENDRALFGGGYLQSALAYRDIDYCIISSKGNCSLFGEITSGVSNGVVGVSNGIKNTGLFSYYTWLSKINMVSFGNAELTGIGTSKIEFGATSNGVLDRGIFAGGNWNSLYSNSISYMQISTAVQSYEFGQLLTINHSKYQALSNSILNIAVFPYNYTGNTNTIEYINISTRSKGIDFGDLIYSRGQFPGATSNGSNNNGVITEGGGTYNSIQLINISTPGNAVDFGDLTLQRHSTSGVSNGPTSQNSSSGYNIIQSPSIPLSYYSGDKGVFVAGNSSNVIDFITISILSNADTFGSLFTNTGGYSTILDCNGASNQLGNKAVFGPVNGSYNTITTLNISSNSTNVNFSNLSTIRTYSSQTSNGINNRGIIAGGASNSSRTITYSIIDYYSFIVSQNYTNLFGTLSVNINAVSCTNNAINNRAIFTGLSNSQSTATNTIEYITISTPSNSYDFGDLTVARTWSSATSNGVYNKGFTFGGYLFGGSTISNIIDYHSISNLANSADFGDITSNRALQSSLSNGVFNRGIIAGGSGPTSNIDYISMGVYSGNTSLFGYLTAARYSCGAVSNSDTGTVSTIASNLLTETGNDIRFNSVHSGDRGIFSAGRNSNSIGINQLESITISTLCDSTLFGEFWFPGNIEDIKDGSGSSNHIGDKAVFAGASNSYNNITSMNISTSNATEHFSEISTKRVHSAHASNGINNRGIIAGGWVWGTTTYFNIIDYYSFINVNVSTVDFGDISAKLSFINSTSNAVNDRAIFIGGINSSSIISEDVDYISISTLGNSVDFGKLSSPRYAVSSTSNGVYNRAVIFGGYLSTVTNLIEYINILNTSNSIKFGDLSISRRNSSALSNGIYNRAIVGGGHSNYISNSMEYITITSTSNASNFGNLFTASFSLGSVSNSNGGSIIPISNSNIIRIEKINYPDCSACHSGDRGIFSSGSNGLNVGINPMDVVSISTTGNAELFNSFSYSYGTSYIVDGGGASNHTGDRGIFAANGYYSNVISLINVSTVSDNISFCSLSRLSSHTAQTSNGVNNRGIIAGGLFLDSSIAYDDISYYSFIYPTNPVDFGNLSNKYCYCKSTSNAINNRAVIVGCRDINSSIDYINTIEHITISTTSNSYDFGDLTISRYAVSTTSNGVYNYALIFGGFGNSIRSNVIDYIHISANSNALDFGDLSQFKSSTASLSNGIFGRALVAGGHIDITTPVVNNIDYVSILSLSNSNDFGDLTVARNYAGAISNSDGGSTITIPEQYTFGEGANLYSGSSSGTIYSSYSNSGSVGGQIEYLASTGTVGVRDGDIYIVLSDYSLNMFQMSRGIGKLSPGGKFVKYLDNYGIRAIFSGGISAGIILSINECVSINHESNADFHSNLIVNKYQHASSSNGSNNKMLIVGGSVSTSIYPYCVNSTEHINIDTFGNAVNYKSLVTARNLLSSTSNADLNISVIGGGMSSPDLTPSLSIIDYMNVSTSNNAIYFGNLTISRNYLVSGSNGRNNRAIFAGGSTTNSYSGMVSRIDYVTINSLGNAIAFGNLQSTATACAALSSGISGKVIFSIGMGSGNPTALTTLSYLQLSSLGDASTFSNLIVARKMHTGTSNGIGMKGIVGGGQNSVSFDNIEIFGMISPHSSQSCIFGKLSSAKFDLTSASDA